MSSATAAFFANLVLIVHVGVAAFVVLAACQGGRKESVQVGYRGTGQILEYDKSALEAQGAASKLPPTIAPAM